jgi:hypothetical protein
MLKKSYFIIFILTIFNINSINAQQKNLGVGIKLGEPTGLTFKYQMNQRNALDFTLGSSITGSNGLHISLNYLYHYYNVIKTQQDVNLFWGFGARLVTKAHAESSLGVRGIGGIAYNMAKYPVEIFFETAPVFRLFPTTRLDLDMSVGGRYYFAL